jgi:hypothetical protein
MTPIWALFIRVCIAGVCHWQPTLPPLGMESQTKDECEDLAAWLKQSDRTVTATQCTLIRGS